MCQLFSLALPEFLQRQQKKWQLLTDGFFHAHAESRKKTSCACETALK